MLCSILNLSALVFRVSSRRQCLKVRHIIALQPIGSDLTFHETVCLDRIRIRQSEDLNTSSRQHSISVRFIIFQKLCLYDGCSLCDVSPSRRSSIVTVLFFSLLFEVPYSLSLICCAVIFLTLHCIVQRE